MQKFTIICILATFFGCSDNQPNTDNISVSTSKTTHAVQPLQIDNDEEEGWGADIKLSIIEKSENDTANFYKAVSSYKEQELGLLVSVPKRKEGDKGFGQGISLKTIGAQSDYLLQTLSQLYKQPVDKMQLS